MAGEIGRKTEHWGSRFGFIMASVGSAVGLGNFWRFPYTAGENGGGAFILFYIICVLLIGMPLLMAEYAMGRKSGMSAIEGIQSLARAESRSQNWGIAGWVGSLTSFFILSFYMVISTWLMAFLIQSFGGFEGMDASSSGQNFVDTIGQGEHPMRSRWYMLGLLALFLIANIIVVGRGVKGGIEKVATVLMPAFFIMLLVVVGFSIANGDTAKAVSFIFEPKWEDVGFKTFLAALGQAFFSLSIGVGLMITYGAYLEPDTNIPRSSGLIVASDTLVALIAGFAIFPIVFSAGLDPSSGPSLFFISMPVAFGSIPGGAIMAPVFFGLALFAAFTSSISLMEVAVSWLEERQGVTRLGASIGVGYVLFMIGAAYVFSLDYLDFMDFMTEGLLLPLGGLLASYFAGWVLSREMLTSELGEGTIMNAWRFLIRWFVPPFIFLILVFGFMDKIQDQYHVPLPGFLTMLLGPNWVPPAG
ncbi:symporter [Hyphomonas beringensis]|uniref:Transporter n=1 Tax=Hyphomonas beringensis TaxID=1280946 RepID=A0A062U8H7_9PROT|nr:sodium-dependent transporter [Hyphomonas beringensis]KCZ54043.1 symporter [Hyphomonas beringensis]